MAHCAAINCTDSSRKKSDNASSFFKLLKHPNRRKVGIVQLKIADLLKNMNLHASFEDFEENYFERDLRVSYIFLIGCLEAKSH